MTREERSAMIAKLQAENDALAIDIERRRQERIMSGDIGDISDIMPVVSEPFDNAKSIADQEYLTRSYVQQRAATASGIMDEATQAKWNAWFDQRIDGHLDATVDGAIEFVQEQLAPLLERIAKLEGEAAVMRALLSGAVVNLKSRADAA